MSAVSITADTRCDLIRLERTNMVTKLEDRIKIDLVLRVCSRTTMTPSRTAQRP